MEKQTIKESKSDIKHITVVGGGLMGCGIAQIFAKDNTFEVTVYDKFTTEEAIRERINSNLKLFVDNNIFSKELVDSIHKQIRFCNDLKESVKDAQLIIECIPEDMALKQNLFAQLEMYCEPTTIFATNTSVMSITQIGSLTTYKERVVGTHFWNPPYLIPLVEVVKSDYTDESVMETMLELLRAVGKHPIRVEKDVPGFVANRLQHALWREAISIVEHGIADAKTVDEAIKLSFGMRLPVLAPLENSDMIGSDLTLSIHSYLLQYLENSASPSPLLREMATSGQLGFKSGEGFFEWTEEKIAESRNNLTQHLLKVLYHN